MLYFPYSFIHGARTVFDDNTFSNKKEMKYFEGIIPQQTRTIKALRKNKPRRTLLHAQKNEMCIVSEGEIDLNSLLLINPSDTFMIRVQGDSMLKAGINTGDILIVNRSILPENGKIVVAEVNNNLIVKRIKYGDKSIILQPENDEYKPLEVKSYDAFDVWGVVTSVVKSI